VLPVGPQRIVECNGIDVKSGKPSPKIAIVSSGSPEAEDAALALSRRYGDAPIDEADVVVALGGDGLMLQTMHRLMGREIPIYGMNRGSVGFLMNDFRATGLDTRLTRAKRSIVYPLLMHATDASGKVHTARAINEVHLLRQSYQAAKLSIRIDGKVRLKELIADGALVATPAGSTAYNLSVNGPILPLNSPLLALTPISPFRPRRWRGALLPDHAKVVIDILEADKRPVAAVADHTEIRAVSRVEVALDRSSPIVILHDPGHSLDERILREQFGA
jgi:NAD+ kinase